MNDETPAVELEIGKVYDIPEFDEKWKLEKINDDTLEFEIVQGRLKELTIAGYNKEAFLEYISNKPAKMIDDNLTRMKISDISELKETDLKKLEEAADFINSEFKKCGCDEFMIRGLASHKYLELEINNAKSK